VIIQRNAIVVKQDPSFLVYKHFDLRDRRVAESDLEQGSLPYSVDTSNASGRQQIVEMWKRFGYKATLKDSSGKTTACLTYSSTSIRPEDAVRCWNRFHPGPPCRS